MWSDSQRLRRELVCRLVLMSRQHQTRKRKRGADIDAFDPPVEAAAYLKQVFTRTDSHSLRYMATDMVEASDILTFLLTYRADLTP